MSVATKAAPVTMAAKVKTTVKNVQLVDNELTAWVEQKLSFKANEGGKWLPKVLTLRFAYDMAKTEQGWKFTSARQLMTNEPWSFKTTQ